MSLPKAEREPLNAALGVARTSVRSAKRDVSAAFKMVIARCRSHADAAHKRAAQLADEIRDIEDEGSDDDAGADARESAIHAASRAADDAEDSASRWDSAVSALESAIDSLTLAFTPLDNAIVECARDVRDA